MAIRAWGKPQILAAVLAGAWCLASLAFVLVWCTATGRTFAGPYGVLFDTDQFRYLYWIRQAGEHGLISADGSHALLQPMFLVSGLLWRAGLSLTLSYLVWTPVALGVLLLGYGRFVRRFVCGREAAAALLLAILYVSPLDPLMDYGGIVNANGANNLIIASGHGAAYWQAWGYLPSTVALGLTALCLLRMADGTRLAAAGAMAAFVALVHPWGGLEILLVCVALLATRRVPRRAGWVALGAAVPLLYLTILSHADAGFALPRLRGGLSGPWLALLPTFGPLAAIAALGVRRRPQSAAGLVLGLWLVAGLVAWLLLPSSRDGALEGLSLPLAVLAVRGWRRVAVPRPRTVAAAVLALAVVPGAAYTCLTFRDVLRLHEIAFGLKPGERRAIDVAAASRGLVLATDYLAPALAPLTGLAGDRLALGPRRFFTPKGPTANEIRDLAQLDVSSVVADCFTATAGLTARLLPVAFTARQLGCATVYVRPVPR